MSGIDKEVLPLVELARQQGWRVEQEANRLAWWPPDKTKQLVFCATRIGDPRALKNLRAELRRSGLWMGPPLAVVSEHEEVKEVQAKKPESTAHESFLKTLSELVDEEIDRRTQELQRRNQLLEEENQELRARLAQVKKDARREAIEAVDRYLAENRLA